MTLLQTKNAKSSSLLSSMRATKAADIEALRKSIDWRLVWLAIFALCLVARVALLLTWKI